MSKIISWNVNGIRACFKKGFKEYLLKESPDVLCLQESKAHVESLDDSILNVDGYHSYWHSAERKGYSGTGIYCKEKPLSVSYGFGNQKYDCEGRVLIAEFQDYHVFSVYFPNGQQGPERLKYKLEFYHDLLNYCAELRNQNKRLIICGDYNTAHTEIDLANPNDNVQTSGFMPIEREWIEELIRQGYIDTFREFNSNPDHYTWWSYRTNARDRNVGWRIDYVFVTPDLKDNLESAFIHSETLGSDHCPVGITLKMPRESLKSKINRSVEITNVFKKATLTLRHFWTMNHRFQLLIAVIYPHNVQMNVLIVLPQNYFHFIQLPKRFKMLSLVTSLNYLNPSRTLTANQKILLPLLGT